VFLGRTDAQLVIQASKPSTPSQSAEEQKVVRLAKLEAWKQKQAAEQAQREADLAAAGGARSILTEIDKKAELSTAATASQSPVVSGNVSPAPYAGKFDPKAIVKKAHASTATIDVLGADVAAPQLPKQSTTPNTSGDSKANNASVANSTRNSKSRCAVSLISLADKF
jgi:ATP-dependent RNA helicase DDX46/PRP5